MNNPSQKLPQSLPITSMLEEKLFSSIQKDEKVNNQSENKTAFFLGGADTIRELLPQVRQLEASSIEKAKEEERERIVGILDEMKKENEKFIEGEGYFIPRYSLNEAIERISQ